MSAPLPSVRGAATRELLLPLGFILCFVLYYLLQQPLMLGVGVATPILLLYLWAPSWAWASIKRFDRDAVSLLSSGRATDLDRRFGRAVGMRLFAPPALVAERRALVASENGRMVAALSAYSEAMQEYGDDAPLRVLLGYAHACFDSGRDEEAVRVYRQLLQSASGLPGVEPKLARAMVRSGEELRAALALLARLEAQGEGPEAQAELTLVRALAHAKLGESEHACALAEGVREQGAGLDQWRLLLDKALASAAPPRG